MASALSQSSILLRTALQQAKGNFILLACLLCMVTMQVILSTDLLFRHPSTLFFHHDHSNLPPPSPSSTVPAMPRIRKSLTELAGTFKNNVGCAPGLVYVNDTVLDPKLAWVDNRKIPKIIHVTSKSRCMTKEFADNLDKWRLKGYSLFLHDDDAVMELFKRDWPEFPQFQQLRRCILYPRGAVLADIWRLLILWEYGGIYTDMDTAPNKFNENTIQPEDDAFFVFEINSLPSQWFMVASPAHPMIYFAIQSVLENLQYKMLQDTGNFRIVWTTGPGVVGQGFRWFVRSGQHNPDQARVYVGAEDRTVRIVGNRTDQDEYVTRVSIKDKENKYKSMNMTHIIHMGLEDKSFSNMSCLETLYRYDKQYIPPNAPLW